jgi:hypothetical protein
MPIIYYFWRILLKYSNVIGNLKYNLCFLSILYNFFTYKLSITIINDNFFIRFNNYKLEQYNALVCI